MIESGHMIVGVLIPTYQRKVFLQQALKSVIGQTDDKIEIIVIDNGSSDGTTEFMASVSDPRVRYIRNETNIGMIGSINKGINRFSDKVEWCTILSDDDVLDNNFILKLVHAINETNAKSIVHSRRIFIDHNGDTIREASHSPRTETALDYLQERAIFWRQTYLTGVLFNRRVFNEINGYPHFSTGLATDDAFIFALSLKDRLVFERHAISYIRLHEGAESITAADGIKKLHTLKQFKEYCYKAATASGALGKKEQHRFKRVMKKYLKSLNSSWWVQTASDALRRKGSAPRPPAELLSLVDDAGMQFDLRVKCDAALLRHAGWYPEVNRCYRFFWSAISEISHFYDIRIRHLRLR